MCPVRQLGPLVASLALAVPAAAGPGGTAGVAAAPSEPRALAARLSRLLTADSATSPTVDEVDSALFSRPPYSSQETSSIVFSSAAAIYVLCAIILLVAANLDSSERRRRRARAIVPEESVPCAIAEQYYLDEHLVALRSSQDFEARKQRKGFCSFLLHYGAGFADALSRQHLCLSLLVKAIPTFTRLKRGILIVVHLHLCMLTSSFAYNVLEHDKPNGKYEMLSCGGELVQTTCSATLPLSLLAAAATFPVFRFAACRQMRLTCFASQRHPSSSLFPLNVRKFARIPAKSAWESLCCMRNAHERLTVSVLQSRSLAHRVVHMLWRTTQPSVKDLRFYGVFTSWCILFAMVAFCGLTAAYVILFTAYLKDEVVYHWLAWTLTMFFSSIFVLEPLQILLVEVFWCAFVANFAQRWSFGAHALAHTTRYKEVVRGVEQQFIKNLRHVAATRVQKWWLAVLDMYRAINEQTVVAANFQAITQKTVLAKKYAKERKWCLKIEVKECYDLEQVHLEDLMSPLVRLQCDVGNPSVLQTKVAWDAHKRASFAETFFVDIKESSAMYVSVWSKTPTCDEFVGRGYIEFNQLKGGGRDKPEGQDLKVTLHDIEHGEKRARMKRVRGCVDLRVKFIDPAKEPVGNGDDGSEETSWMLPKHRMQFALSKMGGRMKVSKMLGGLGAPMTAPVPVKVPAGPLKLDTGMSWQVAGAPNNKVNLESTSTSNTTPFTPASPTGSTFRGAGADRPPSTLTTSAPPPAASAVDAQGAANPLPPPAAAPTANPASPLSLNNAAPLQAAPQALPGAVPDGPGGVEDDADGA